jgi:hypothetical protein
MTGFSIERDYSAFLASARSHNVIFYYVGYFSQKIIAAMSEAVRLQMAETRVDGSTRRKLFSSFIEMAQNIVHYSAEALTSSPDDDPQLRHGSVCISVVGPHYRLMCTNPVATAAVESLREKLEPLRSMTCDEIRQAYKRTLRAETPEGSKGAGLGLLTLARDASAPLEFQFQPIEANPASTLFCITATI